MNERFVVERVEVVITPVTHRDSLMSIETSIKAWTSKGVVNVHREDIFPRDDALSHMERFVMLAGARAVADMRAQAKCEIGETP